MKVVIVGGVAGGASAAARVRRLDESAEVVLIERGGFPSFANCGMPYYIGGEITSRDKLLVSPIERLRVRYNLDVRVRQSVERIDRENKRVWVRRCVDGSEYAESYDKLILSPGAAPLRPPLPGVDLPTVHTLRSLEDADRLHAATAQADSAVLIGGGFIGLEMAENLVRRGLRVTLVERNPQVLGPWDAEMTAPVLDVLAEQGVDVRLGDEAVGFADEGGRTRVRFKSGGAVDCSFVVLAIGVRPESTLAQEAGLGVGPRGGIQVDRHMRTSDPDVYAVGDAVEVTDAVTGAATQVPLAGPANRQGRIAADHIFGRDSAYRGTQGTAVLGLFGLTAAMTGLSEKACLRGGVRYAKVYLHPAHHAGYYPGAEGMSLKLLFDPDSGRLLGAQGVGGAGVDKRIDVLAMAVQAGMTVYDLEEAELCYAPQFGSAKDPVNMAGFIAAGVLRGDHPVAHSDRLLAGELDDAMLLDVRTPQEHARGALPGAVNIPLDELRERLAEVPTRRPVVCYCMVGQRGYMATRLLAQHGRDVRNLSGGYTTHQHYVRVAGVAVGA